MIDDRWSKYRKKAGRLEYSGMPHLSRLQESDITPPQPTPKPPAPTESKTSSFLSRLARTATREAGGGKSGWISSSSVDRSSPSANLESRLRWMETAFKKKGESPPQQIVQETAVKPVTPAEDVKGNVRTMRSKIQNVITDLQSIDRELSELEK